MSQEFLDLPDVPTTSEDLAGSRMAKPVGMHTLKTSNAGILEDDLSNARPVQGFQGWQGTDEYPPLPGLRSADPQVVHQGLTDIDGHRQDEDATALAHNLQGRLPPVDVIESQAGDFPCAHPKTGKHDDDC